MDNIDSVLRDYIRNEFMIAQPDLELDDNLPLIEEGVIDSLGIFMVISYIEETFKVKVQPGDVILENFATINTIRALIRLRQADGA